MTSFEGSVRILYSSQNIFPYWKQIDSFVQGAPQFLLTVASFYIFTSRQTSSASPTTNTLGFLFIYQHGLVFILFLTLNIWKKFINLAFLLH